MLRQIFTRGFTTAEPDSLSRFRLYISKALTVSICYYKLYLNMSIFLFILGLIFLIAGAETLVRGASRFAADMGISPLIIGLTIVAFGTSSPELAVSIKSSLSGQSDIVLGNVVGSNIFNVLFILGLSALILPLTVSQQLVRLDVPIMIGLSAAVFVLSLDLIFSRTNGIILVSGLIAYLTFLFYQSRKNTESQSQPNLDDNTGSSPAKYPWLVNIILIVTGLALLVIGSRWLVDSAIVFARYLGVDELIIGLTIIAAGTSLPEVVTSVIASVRGKQDIAVGNVVGSNIFNLMGVLGVTSIIAPGGIEVANTALHFDLPAMVVVAFACLPIFFTGGVISRWEGTLFLSYYMAYTIYLVLAASHHTALSTFSEVMLYFVAPLTVITIAVIVIQELRAKNRI